MILFSSCEEKPKERKAIRILYYTSPFFWMTCMDSIGDLEPGRWRGDLLYYSAHDARVEFDYIDYGKMSGPMLTPCIEDDAENHQVFYSISEGLDISFSCEDTDCTGNPIGIRTTLTTGQSSKETLTITLVYGPDKFPKGVKDGNITHAGGAVDFERTLDVVIEQMCP